MARARLGRLWPQACPQDQAGAAAGARANSSASELMLQIMSSSIFICFVFSSRITINSSLNFLFAVSYSCCCGSCGAKMMRACSLSQNLKRGVAY